MRVSCTVWLRSLRFTTKPNVVRSLVFIIRLLNTYHTAVLVTQFRVLRDRGTQIFRPDVPISYLAWHAAGGRQTCPAGTVAALKNRMLAQSVLDFQFDAGPKHVAQIQPRRGSTQQILCDFINEKGAEPQQCDFDIAVANGRAQQHCPSARWTRGCNQQA